MLFKKSLLTLAISSVVLGMSACSDSDDDPAPAPNNSGTTATVPNEIKSEAAPATETDVFFGGDNDADSSGSIQYLVIAESGVAFQPDAELQGLTLEGVGSGTTISYVQILGSEDDGIEWFGGKVDVDHIVINSQDDDGLDFDDGYSGNINYAIVRMGDSDGDTGIEADSAGPSLTAAPLSEPNLSYITVLGNVGKGSKSTLGAMFKKGFAGKMYRSAFVDDDVNTVGAGAFNGACFDVDDDLAAGLQLTDVACDAGAGEVVSDSDGNQDTFKASANYDVEVADLTIDPATLALSGFTAPTGSLPTGADDNAYIGAVDPTTATPWWDGWTIHLAGNAGSLKNEDFNPLAAEIADSTITPAAAHACPTGTSEAEKTFVDLGGVSFPVCLLNSHFTGSNTFTLTNDHVYALTDYIVVGNGGKKDKLAADADATKLVIEAGVQIFADAGEKAGIRVTRGAQIEANGTAALPVIMSAADFNLSAGEITGGTDFSGRGDWGGLVIDGYAKTNSTDE